MKFDRLGFTGRAGGGRGGRAGDGRGGRFCRLHGGQDRGAFSLALLRAMRAAGAGESAEHVFQRAEAGLGIEKAPQYPVLAGNAAARAAPLFGGRADHRAGKTVVAVRGVAEDGTVTLKGGWANGLTVGSDSVVEPTLKNSWLGSESTITTLRASASPAFSRLSV